MAKTLDILMSRSVSYAKLLRIIVPAAFVIGLPQHVLGQEQNTPPATAESAEPAAGIETPPEPAVADTAADQDTALEDYEASEQISEDLSVSFPVDI